MKAIAEAPSKAIVTGEHFVVHGAWALAAALPRRVRVSVIQSDSLEVRSDRLAFRDPGLAPVAEVIIEAARELSTSPSVKVEVKSEIPQGAGLGSSASTMVAAVAAFARLTSSSLSPDEVARISMAGERSVHGRPSGIDPAICSLGGVILFRPGTPPRRLKLGKKTSLIVALSGESRSTRHQISRVSDVRTEHPGFFDGLKEAVSELSLLASERMRDGDRKALGELMTLNQSMLATLGVSTPKLDALVKDMILLGGYGAKLTGAGGGGSAIGVAPTAKEKSIVSGLHARGFEAFQAQLPVKGVRSWLER